MPTTRDYYEVLGLEKQCSADDVKRAYRRMAMKFHPDRNPDDKVAEASFKECAEAYEVLHDPERRARYDRFGHEGLRSTPGHDFRSMHAEDIFSMFEDIFGGGGGGGGRSRRQQRGRVPRGYDLETEVEIVFEDVLNGTDRDVEFRRLDVCQTCSGNGAKPGTTPEACGTCRGQGQVEQQGLGGMFRMVTACPHCRGRGSVVTEKCGDCRGTGRVSVERSLTIKIPPGIHDGQIVRVATEGEPPPPEASVGGEGVRGDLHVVVRVNEHEQFERDGDHLLIAVPMAFTQVALGAEIDIPLLDGQTTLAVPPGTQHGAMFRIDGQGLPNLRGGQRGDLVVIVQLVVPKKLSDSQQDMLREYAVNEDVATLHEKTSWWHKIKDVISG